MSLTRTSGSGLLDRNESDNGSFPFVTSEWTAPTQVTKSIESNRLKLACTSSALTRFITRDITGVAESMVYAKFNRSAGAQVGVGVLVSDNTPGSNDGVEASTAGGFSGGRFLVEWVNGATTVIDSTGSGVNQGSPHRISAWADAAAAAMRDHDAAASESGTYSPAQTGKPAMYVSTTGSVNITVDKFFVFSGRYITVTGLPSGYKAKLRDGSTVLAEATESGGTAVIDGLLVQDWWNADNLQITTGADVAIEQYNGDVWAGETWSFVGPAVTLAGSMDSVSALSGVASVARGLAGVLPAVSALAGALGVTRPLSGVMTSVSALAGDLTVAPTSRPATPVITATATGPQSISVLSSAYSHPFSVPIGAVEWQIASDPGFASPQSVEIPFADPADVPEPFAYPWGDLEPSTPYYVRVRHRDTDGSWSLYSDTDTATTESATLPGTPSITAAVPTAVSVSLTGSAFSDSLGRAHVSTDWQVDEASGDFSSPVNESLNDVSGLTSENLPGLTAGTAYKARVRYRADDGVRSAWSAAFPFSTTATPANRPAQPTLVVSAIEQKTAILTGSAYSDPSSSPHTRTQWYVTNYPGGGTFGMAYRVLNFTTPTYLLSIGLDDLLQPDTLYNAAVRYQAADGDWSDWSAWVPFTTVAAPLDGQLLQILQPRQGEPIRGASVDVEWIPESVVDATFELEYSADLGVTWLPLADEVASSPYSWDVSALTDGVYMLRVRGVEDTEVTGWQYLIVYVDNADAEAGGVYLFNYDAEDGTTLGDWEPAWEESGIDWQVGEPGDVRFTGPQISGFESAFTYLPAFEPRQVDVIGEVLIGSAGGAFPWQWFPEQAWAGVGVFADGPVTGTGPRDGITATIYALPIAAYGDCELRGSGDGFLEIAVYEAGARILTEIVPIGRVHVVNRFDGCNKVPRYGIRLRLTTIANLGGGRRRLRVQASVTGRGVELPSDGWHYQGTCETGLDCGRAAFTARQITTTVDPYRSFTNLTVIPYEFGECSAPIGFAEPVDVEACPPPYFDLTIFDDDDETPLFGEVDEYGEIVESSFSTWPDHPRPWLRRWRQGAEHEVDPIGGSSNVGSLVVEVVDRRVDPCDQGTGFLTAAGGDDNGFSAYIGRRAVGRERLSDGSINIVQNGPITSVTLLDTLVTHQLNIASMRERERDVPLFDTQHRTFSVYPRGPVGGYGFLGTVFSSLPLYLEQPAPVARGQFRIFDTNDGVIIGVVSNEDSGRGGAFSYYPAMDVIGSPRAVFSDAGFESWAYADVTFAWRYPAGEWNYLEDMPAQEGDSSIFTKFIFGGLGQLVQLVFLTATEEDAALLPTDGAMIEWQVLADTVPSELFPFYYDGNAGTLLRNIYDGLYSPEVPGVRYDEECMEAFEAAAPTVRLRRMEPESNLKEWVEKNIYQALGWIPALGENGEICPLDTALPDGAESLPTLDNALVVRAAWNQDGSRATPMVTFRYIREWKELSEETGQYEWQMQTVDVLRLEARAGALLRSRGLVIAPETIRELGGPLADAIGIELPDTAAGRLAFGRADFLVRNNAFGPQVSPVRVRDTAVTRAIKTGQWVILDADWIPNLSTLRRGGPQLGLVVRRQKDPGLAWDLTLFLAGPGAAGLTAPELEAPTVDANNAVCLAVPIESFGWSSGFSTGFGDPGITVRVQYGVGDTEPTDWKLAGTTGSSGDVCTPPMPQGVTVWMRARTERLGYRPSPWSDAVSVDVGATTPALYALSASLTSGGVPTVEWTENPVTLGVRIDYVIHAQGTPPVYDSSVDADATLGSFSLIGETVNPGEQISVRVTPYTGFGGGSVSGTPGTARTASAQQDEELVGSGFSSGFNTGWGN